MCLIGFLLKNIKIKFTKSNDNVYEDIGFKDAKEHLVKADLAIKINQIIKNRNYKQENAAEILGINQPKISAIDNGRLKDFSIESNDSDIPMSFAACGTPSS